jgi:hypothetical protein
MSDTTVLEEIRSLRHTPTCATGARAETRGECNCDAASRPAAWRIEIVAVDNEATALLRIVTPEPLAADEATQLAYALPVMRDRADVLTERRRKKLGIVPPAPRYATCPACGERLRHMLADCSRCSWRLPMKDDEPTTTGKD